MKNQAIPNGAYIRLQSLAGNWRATVSFWRYNVCIDTHRLHGFDSHAEALAGAKEFAKDRAKDLPVVEC